jgi:hypothetical protein
MPGAPARRWSPVRGEDLPRIHPVNVAIVDGRLYVFVIATSPKPLDPS